MSPGSWGSGMGSSSDPNARRTCPSLDDSVTTPTPTPTPMPVPPAICLQVLTKAANTSTGECKVFSDSCLPAGWVKNVDCKPGEIIPPGEISPPMPPVQPNEPRECGPNEMPGMGSAAWAATTTALYSVMPPSCIMPMYRWNIDKKNLKNATEEKHRRI